MGWHYTMKYNFTNGYDLFQPDLPRAVQYQPF